jgi:hypothetical protein
VIIVALNLYSNAIVRKNPVKTERWNYFKGDYTNMNTFLQCDWNGTVLASRGI